MKLYRRQKTLIVESETFISILGWFSTGAYGYANAKAAAFFPFIFVRNQAALTPIVLNHEQIHHRQQLETLYIGLWLLTVVEKVYAKLILNLPSEERYFYTAAEQESHLHQADLKYLETRKSFSLFRYVSNKKQLKYIEGQEPAVHIIG